MTNKKEPKKVITFIDGNNLFHISWNFYHTHLIDIQELSQKLCGIYRQLKQIRYYFSPFVRQVNERMAILQQAYIEKVRKIQNIYTCEGKYIKKSITLKKELFQKVRAIVTKNDLQGYIEKGIDVKIAVDMINLGLRKEYDTAILISTDSDFVPLITYLQSRNIKIQVAAFQDDIHSCFDLKNHSKSFMNLHHYIPAILRKQKSHP